MDHFRLEALRSKGDLPIRVRNSGKVKKSADTAVFKPTGDRNRVADPNEDAPMLLTEKARSKAAQLRATGQFRGDMGSFMFYPGAAFCDYRCLFSHR